MSEKMTPVKVAMIGLGWWGRKMTAVLQKAADDIKIVCAAEPNPAGAEFAAANGFAHYATMKEALAHPGVEAVILATPHSLHDEQIRMAVAAKKHIFCEKPLAITWDQLKQVEETLERTGGRLMVGFNRRFAPLARELKEFVSNRGPLSVTYRVNAGPIPPDHWLADPAEGGRIIGEACHFFDFFAFLTESDPVELQRISPDGVSSRDDGQFLVRYKDGSVCHLIYTTNGSPGFSKERIEVHAGGASVLLEDFKALTLDDGRQVKRKKLWKQDKGHAELITSFLKDLHEITPSMPLKSILHVTLLTLCAAHERNGLVDG